MRYIGGKVRQAPRIREAIMSLRGARSRYLEPFLGGASVFAAVAPMFESALGADVVPDLILFWEAIRDGWEPPQSMSAEEYERLLRAAPSPLRAWAGFAASYNGRWWGGYGPKAAGRDYLAESYRATMKKSRGLTGAAFTCAPYWSHSVDANTVAYCDPPYEHDTGNHHAGRRTPEGSNGDRTYGASRAFDHRHFWATANAWVDAGALVLVHEYTAPHGWEPVLETARVETMNHKAASSGIRKEVLWVRAALKGGDK